MYFTIRRTKDNQYYWRAVGDNNEIMAHSEPMKQKQSCRDAIDVVKAEAATAKVYDKTDE
ncbi:MAG: YegP family protein [Chloroflexota bacterium]